MVKFGLKLMENRAADYPPDVYMDYEKLKNFIKELASKKLAGESNGRFVFFRHCGGGQLDKMREK
jgi:hypothetical protein